MVTLKEWTLVRAPIARCFDLAHSVEAHLAGNVHWGEAAVGAGGVTSGLVGLGQRVTWRAKHFAIRQRLTSEITAMDRPVGARSIATLVRISALPLMRPLRKSALEVVQLVKGASF